MIITPDILKERAFQKVIKDYLIQENGYNEGQNEDYDKELAIDTNYLFSFLQSTQEKAMNKLKEIYKTNYKNKVLSNIVENLRTRSSIDVLKHGVKDFGVELKLAYFKPPTNLNIDQFTLYEQNIISVTEELIYNEDKRIDLVIFLNGIPIITMELKNSFTGQTYKNAIYQYKNNRSGNEQLFKFKERAIVNFAIDTDEAYMSTRLNGESTRFLPFNKGTNNGAGNPIVDGKLKTHYIWEEVLTKDSLLEIIHKFIYLEKREELLDNGDIKTKETLIFPRYHQLDCVRQILKSVKKEKSGHKYLIQHSAGSGKTNSITWLSHRLASLHDENNNIIFNGVIVVTDRRVLDQQLQNSIYELEHQIGLVAKIDDDSSQLADELEKGTKIIISTIQKFPFILDKLSGTKDKKYAVVIDEAHSSTSGRSMGALKEALSLEEAVEIANEEEKVEVDTEDKINKELEDFTDTSRVSFFGFTATPKGTTLRIFGRQGEDEKYYPFHIYSMKQAIEEGFILDVLKNYITYKMFYSVNKQIEDDPAFDKSKATRQIVKYVSIHPHNIYQKTKIIVEHFRNHSQNKIGGEAKAMLVTSSRLHAVRYKRAFDEYIHERGYSELKTLVAFSGTVKDVNLPYTEKDMNFGISESQLPNEFDKEENRILIVANKYQTGFDQPKLHTMYVDKMLSGVKAVQTLSRLNRIYSGKEDTFVLDFVNDPEDILEAFKPFYKATILGNDINPNDVYKDQANIMDRQVIDIEDINLFNDILYKDKHSSKDQAIMNNCVNNSVARTKDFAREQLLEFRSLLNKFMSLYNLIIQVAPFIDTELHRLSVYSRFLIKKLDISDPTGVDITDKIVLEYYRLQKTSDVEDLGLSGQESEDVSLNVTGSGSVKEPETDYLSSILKNLNEKYGTEWSTSEKLASEQIEHNLKTNENLKVQAKANTLNNFKYAYEKVFMDSVINEYGKNKEFYGKILTDESFRTNFMSMMMVAVYNDLRSTDSVS